jgi:hypothetical protein
MQHNAKMRTQCVRRGELQFKGDKTAPGDGQVIRCWCLRYKATNEALANRVSLARERATGTWSSYTKTRTNTIMAKEMDEKDEDIAPDQEVDFCTMGMFIVGEFTPLCAPDDTSFIGFAAVNVRTVPLKMRGYGSGSLVVNLQYSFWKNGIDVAWLLYGTYCSNIQHSTNFMSSEYGLHP